VKSAVGTFVTNNQLYHAAVVPLASGANLVRVGYLINASAIDGTFADRIAESTKAGVMFVPSPKLASVIARSSNAPSVGMQQMSGLDQIFKTGKPMPPSNVHIEQSEYVMTTLPLQAGNQTVGAAVFL